ncbi:MAG TPA: LysR family transcriptional regulator [Chthoniobacterales bacterium]|jgi:DNA-binding transcriptional LysR family regulator|nr:LysR family transcriptional regulator [Chthoniobacterales bacterium]
MDDRRITLEQLRVLVSVIEAGGFQSASRQIHRTQSAVTQSLKKLEEILGCRLLERRQGHVLGLTPEGERFLPAAREILARVSDALIAVQRPELKGKIALGVPDDFRIADLPEAISRCLELNRKLRIQVTSALSVELSNLMLRGELDMAILKQTSSDDPLAGELDARSLVWGLLRAEPLHWVYNRRVAFRDLDQIPLVAFPDGCAYRRAALSALKRRKKSTFFSYISASYENIRSAVSAGLGIGVLPLGAVAGDHVVLTAKDGFPDLPPVHLMLMYRSPEPVFDQFADMLRGLVAPKTDTRKLRSKIVVGSLRERCRPR